MNTMLKLLLAAAILSGCASVDLSTEASSDGAAGSDSILQQMAKDSEAG